jgi:hypothetical protein
LSNFIFRLILIVGNGKEERGKREAYGRWRSEAGGRKKVFALNLKRSDPQT